MKRFFLILSLSILLLFSACTVVSVDGELNLEANEKWSLTVTAVLPGEDAAFLQLLDEEELMDTMSDYDLTPDDLPEGVTFDVSILDENDEGNVPLQMSFGGVGYERLNDMSGERVVWSENVAGQELTNFRMEGMGSDTAIRSTTFTLNANGHIRETNGQPQGPGTAVWRDFDGDMTATIEPGKAGLFDLSNLDISKSNIMIISGLLCCLCLVVIVILVVVVILVTRNKKQKTASEASQGAAAPPPADSDNDRSTPV